MAKDVSNINRTLIAKYSLHDKKSLGEIAKLTGVHHLTVKRILRQQAAARSLTIERKPRPNPGLSDDQKAQIIQLVKQGARKPDIARQLGVKATLLYSYLGTKSGQAALRGVAVAPKKHSGLSDEQKQQAASLYAQGHKRREIARIIGAVPSQVSDWTYGAKIKAGERRPNLTESEKTVARTLRAQGVPGKQIAKQLETHPTTVYRLFGKEKQNGQALVPTNGAHLLVPVNPKHQEPTHAHATDREEVRLAIARAVGYTAAIISFSARSAGVSEAEFGHAVGEIIHADFAR